MTRRPLAVAGELRAEGSAGRCLTLRGHGSTVVLAADRLATLRGLRRRSGAAPAAFESAWAEIFERSDLTFEVRSGDHTVAVAEPGRGPGLLGRILGLGPFRPRWRSLLAAWRQGW